jgi:hypothetical protein
VKYKISMSRSKGGKRHAEREREAKEKKKEYLYNSYIDINSIRAMKSFL